MSESREIYSVDNNLLTNGTNVATMDDKPPEQVVVSRRELEQEHVHLLGRLQQLRRLLGYQPLPTGKQLRREGCK